MKEIQLTQGYVAIVDDDDYEWASKIKWQATGSGNYATRFEWNPITRKLESYKMHRKIMNCPSDMQVDHINHNTLDNRKENLRIVTSNRNNQNRNKGAGCTSKYKGVYWHKNNKKWQAHLKFNKKELYLGNFDSEEEAALAYDRKARELFGEYACTNFQ